MIARGKRGVVEIASVSVSDVRWLSAASAPCDVSSSHHFSAIVVVSSSRRVGVATVAGHRDARCTAIGPFGVVDFYLRGRRAGCMLTKPLLFGGVGVERRGVRLTVVPAEGPRSDSGPFRHSSMTTWETSHQQGRRGARSRFARRVDVVPDFDTTYAQRAFGVGNAVKTLRDCHVLPAAGQAVGETGCSATTGRRVTVRPGRRRHAPRHPVTCSVVVGSL